MLERFQIATAPERPVTRGTTLAFLLVLLATAAFHLSTMDSNHRWWGDFSMYMAHAKNIATGHPYSDTGFIYNPNSPGYSPPVYPPVYPVLLAPLYKIYNLNLYAPKVLDLTLLLMSLAVFFVYYAARLDTNIARVAALATCAFSPWYWIASNLINSDVPFMLFTFSALIAMDRLVFSSRKQPGYLALSIVTGLLIYLAYGTRSIGLLLVPALLLFDLIRNRAIRIGTIVAVLVFVAGYELQLHLLTQDLDKSYAQAMVDLSYQKVDNGTASPLAGLYSVINQITSNLAGNIDVYSRTLYNHWDNGIVRAITIIMTALTGILAIIGYLNQLVRRSSSLELFTLIYIGALMTVPVSQSFRYLMPVLPAYILYIFKGSELVERFAFRTVRGHVPAILLILCSAGYLGNYLLVQSTHVYFGVTDPDAAEMFAYIREHVPEDSLIKFERPRIVSLFTGRKSAVYNITERSMEYAWNDFRITGATHLLLYNGENDWAHIGNNRKLLAAHSHEIRLLHKNPHLELYSLQFNETVQPTTAEP